MDVVALSAEDQYTTAPESTNKTILSPDYDEDNYSDFSSLYKNCVATLRNLTSPDPETGEVGRWAVHFHSYDRLALVNTKAYIEVGGWDTMIPFYMVRGSKLLFCLSSDPKYAPFAALCEGSFLTLNRQIVTYTLE